MAKPGVVRRPLEYILPIIIAALIFLLVYILDKTKEVQDTDRVESTETVELTGTVTEIGQLAEDDENTERAIDRDSEDRDYEAASSIDTDAEALGGVYDENDF